MKSLTIPFFCLSLSLLALTSTATAHAQSSPRPPQPLPEIEDVEATNFYLITVGLGPKIHARYGHTFVHVVSGDTGISYIYNWGMFSFNDPFFFAKFYLGDRQYWVASTPIREILYLYEKKEDRNVWQQKIHLTSQQKAKFLANIRKAISKENMFFQYEHFYANCATIPRDLLNQALDGYLKKQLSSLSVDKKYRYYVREHMAYIPPLGFLLDIVMNSSLDGSLNRWDESFYPIKLAEYLSELQRIDDKNQPIPEEPLLGKAESLVKASSDHLSSRGHFALYFSMICGFFLLIMLISTWYPHHSYLRIRDSLSLLFSCFWGLFCGTLGLIMLISWIFSTHLDMHHNLNLLLFFVTDFLYILWAMMYLKPLAHNKQKTKKTWVFSSPRVCRSYLLVHLIASIFYLVIPIAGLSQQNISTTLYYLMPLQIGFCLWLYRICPTLHTRQTELINGTV